MLDFSSDVAADGLSAFAVIDESLGLALPPHAKWKRLPAKLDEFNELGFVALARSRGPGTAAMTEAAARNSRKFVPLIQWIPVGWVERKRNPSMTADEADGFRKCSTTQRAS